MSQSNANIFSLQQARQTLPLIRPIVDDALSCHQTIKERLNDQFMKPEDDVTKPEVRDVEPRDRYLRKFRENLTDYVNELYQIGAEIHDFQHGRVDFPSRLQDRVVYLCWQTGEDDIQYWHEVYESCQERQQIDEQDFTKY